MDIIINENTVPLILDDFSSDRELAAVVGMLSEEIPHKNLLSQYFNLRKHYDYLLINGELNTLYTSITAIRKDIFSRVGGFNERYNTASMEDAELGRRLFRLDYKIKLNKKIRVVHLKYHTLKSLLISDFLRAAHFIKFLIREWLAGSIAKDKRFGSFRGGSLITVSVAPVMVLAFPLPFLFKWGSAVFFACVLIFVLSNYSFLRFTKKIVGWRNYLLMPLMIFIDSLAIFTGVVFGLAGYFRMNKF